MHPTVTPSVQLHAIATNAIEYFDLFLRQQGGFDAKLPPPGWTVIGDTGYLLHMLK